MARLLRARDDVDGVLDALVQGNDSKVSWTRLLAHHVNNQLTSIFFIIDRFIQADATDAEQTTYVAGLKDVADRIQETIRRLMTVSQFDSLVTLADVNVR